MRYAKMPEINNPERKWPNEQITKSPAWCAVDLRDGNQALPNPMTPEQKLKYFKLLVDIGFKEIEIGFPSASDDDFNFCRKLIEDKLIPPDVTISVLTQARSHLITRTVEALKGADRAIIHMYIATSELHRKFVFGMEKENVITTTVASIRQIKDEAKPLVDAGSFIGLEFSPEEFTDTEPDFALEVCMKVVEEWNPKAGEKVILNLPMTVERRMPNDYADMIEIFMRNNKYPDKTVISLHAHNDMGCAVAASLLALKAGAQRVEGTLFGHGERTGNVDLITIALNLSYMNINTGLTFDNILRIIDTVEEITNIPVHVRHPYTGQLVFTAFSGSHQDAINKGFIQKEKLADHFGGWKIPYLHVDPKSLGRSFEKYIRINSQSGKGGIAYILQAEYNIIMPKWVQVDFASHVQDYADSVSREIGSDEVYDLFRSLYLNTENPLLLINFWPRPMDTNPSSVEGELVCEYSGSRFDKKAVGNGPISALVNAVKLIDGIPDFILEDYVEDSIGKSADAEAVCFVKIIDKKTNQGFIGAGIDPNVNQAAVKAVISAINRLFK